MSGLLVTLLLFPLIGAAVARVVGDVPRWLAGVGGCGVVIFVAGVLRVPFTVALVVLAIVSLAVVLAVRAPRRPDRVPLLPFIVLAIPIPILLFHTAVIPLHDYDGCAFWMLKAKAIAHDGSIDGPYFRGESTASLRNAYPLLLPIDAAAILKLVCTDDDRAIRWLHPLILLALALEVGRRAGGWVGALVAWLPQLAVAPEGGALSAYSDIALAAFAGMAVLDLLDAKPRAFGFWLACLVLTKNEGLPFAVILLLAWLVLHRKWTPAIPFAVATAALFAWRLTARPTDEEDLIGLLRTLPHHLDRLGHASLGFLRYLFLWTDWGFFWIAVLIAIGVLAWKRDRRALTVAAACAAMIAVYIAIFVVTAWDLDALLRVSAARLWTHFAAIGAILIAASRLHVDRDRQRELDRLGVDLPGLERPLGGGDQRGLVH